MSVHFKNRGVSIDAEVRNGPLVTCEARILQTSSNWIVDHIETPLEFRNRGYATELIEAATQASGRPVHAFAIKPEAMGFWDKMQALGLFIPAASTEQTTTH